MSDVKPIPEGVPRLTPYLSVQGATRAIEFYKKAFGATEVHRLTDPGGKILHAEIEIAGSPVMLAEEFPAWDNLSPPTLGGTPVRLHLYVEDVDAVAERAVAAGAVVLIPVADQFYGDRSGRVQDPFGHVWILATHVEDVADAEMQRRADAMFGGGKGSGEPG